MHLHVASKRAQKLRLALNGPSGSGKTMSALLLAYGLCGSWSKVALLDTEEGAGSLYSHLGPYNTIELGAPFTPGLFQQALDLAEDAGMEVIVLDSLSSEWMGEGGIRERLKTEEYDQAMREHRYVLKSITRSCCHVICTMRSRQWLTRFRVKDRGFWETVETPLQQEGIEYLFHTVLKLDGDHQPHVVKDQTGIFTGKDPAVLESGHGALLLNWCNREAPLMPEGLQERINACQTQAQLQKLLFEADLPDVALVEAFTRRRLQLEEDGGREDNDLSMA